MSKFLVSSGERIKHVEKPITVYELHHAMEYIMDRRMSITFDMPGTHINSVIKRGNCCLLTMLEHISSIPDSKRIIDIGQLWDLIPNERGLYLFHYRHDLSVVRPVLSVNVASDFHLRLGGPVEHRMKIVKGQYSE